MENASDAIIMAGAMLIFVIALTVAMTVFSQAKETVDTVIYTADETNYYEYEAETLEGLTSNVKNRIVGLETVIPTLYKYYKENYTVVFLKNDGTPMELYETKTNQRLWSGSTELKTAPILSKYGLSESTKTVCSFDVDEETKRREPWTGSTIDYKSHLDCFLEGKNFTYPSNPSSVAYHYETGGEDSKNEGGFIKRARENNWKFIETIGEYSMTEKTGITADLDNGIRNNKNKRVIVYKVK